MNKKVKSGIFLFAAPMIWGVAFVMQKEVDTNVIGTLTFNTARFFLGAITMLPLIFLFEREPHDKEKMKKTVFYGVLTGMVLFVASEFQMYGISLNKSAGKSGFLTGLYMVIVPFLGFFVFKKKILLREWLAAITALFGLFLLSFSDGFGNVNFGDLMVIVSAFFWATHILMIDRFVDKVSPMKYSMVQYLTCTLLNGVTALFCEHISVSGITVTWIPILYTGILSIGLGYTFQILGQKDANPNFASIVLASEGVFAAVAGAVSAMVIYGVKLNPFEHIRAIVGCALMFLGTVISQIDLKKDKSSKSPRIEKKA